MGPFVLELCGKDFPFVHFLFQFVFFLFIDLEERMVGCIVRILEFGFEGGDFVFEGSDGRFGFFHGAFGLADAPIDFLASFVGDFAFRLARVGERRVVFGSGIF